MIPKKTLHRELHYKIHDIPKPNEQDCKLALMVIQQLAIIGAITDDDPPWQRVDLLINIWHDTNPATIEVLKWQRDIIFNHYAKRD